MKYLDALQNKVESETSYTAKRNKPKYNYFSHTLKPDEKEGKKIIRVLPNLQNPTEESFLETKHFHEIKVDGKWTKIWCNEKNDGEHCPICEAHKSLRNDPNPDVAKLALSYGPRLFYIARIIDRDNESKGIQYWRFRHNSDNSGIMDSLYSTIKDAAEETGSDPLDSKTGRDIIISLGKSSKGYTNIKNMRYSDAKPVMEDMERFKKLYVEHRDLTGGDVYAKRSDDFLSVIGEFKTPVWDKEKKCYVAKEDIEESDETSFGGSVSTNTMSNESTSTSFGSNINYDTTENRTSVNTQDISSESFSSSNEEESEELPF